MPPTYSGQRHLGLVLATMGWFIVAFITILLSEQVTLYESPGVVNFFFFHLGILIVFFFFSIPYGLQFFTCNNKKLIILRGVLGVGSFYAYTFAKNWSEVLDHSVLYSIDPLWAVLLLLIAKHKLSKLSWVGIAVSIFGVGIIYTNNYHGWNDLPGFAFGLTSGASLAVIILITYSIVKTDHTSRIGFYHGVIGCLFSLTLLSIFYFIDTIQFPHPREIVISIFLGIAFAYALYCFIQSAFYTEPYVIGVAGYSLIFFTEVLSWIMTREIAPLSTLIGSALIIFGGIKVVLGSYINETKKQGAF
ncbi:MAG: DMT family transporter [Candidatus Algichlamydia australiensis]|nr:DMT family transporter [Chlamydiales bacterium]